MGREACDRLEVYPDRRLRQMLVSEDYGNSDSGRRRCFVFMLSSSVFLGRQQAVQTSVVLADVAYTGTPIRLSAAESTYFGICKTITRRGEESGTADTLDGGHVATDLDYRALIT
jgi:hypothetical protein